MESLKLSTPIDLSFNYYEFSKDTFSVDQFLQEHRNMANLETMRDDLGIYLKSLRSAMIELINKDYADFVNLSTNLIGLDKSITNIQLPLGQLKEELLMLQASIEDVLSEVSAQLLKRKAIQDKKHSLQSLNRVFSFLKKLNDLLCGITSGEAPSLKPLQLERAAMEYNQLQFHVSWCASHLSDSNKQNLKQITTSLYNSLNKHFVECLNNNKGEQLYRVLNVYLAIDKSSLAEDTYRREKVSPLMKALINEEALASNPRGLSGLFDSLIAFIDNEMQDLQKATQFSDKKMKGFDFVVNSYWPEVEERLEMDLSSIYAPGNPEHFFSCYNAALQFLEQLEKRCDSKALRKHPLYQNFMLRWNLPVYFQIRFQEIAGSVEEVLLSIDKEEMSGEWKMTATKTVWQSLLRCWEDKVFIAQLTHRFWKLNLQILGRYYTWTKELLQKGKSEGDRLGVNVWVWLYTDVASLSSRLDELFLVASSRLLPAIPQATRDQLYKCLCEQKQLLIAQLPLASARLVQDVCAPSIAALRHVSEVPRLYRRTNREPPTRSLPYTDTMLDAPLSFHATHHNHPQLPHWLQTIFSEITKQYYVAVMDVLTSVQKTEESLRRLKKIRDRSSGTFTTPDRGGDDDKIRMQLYFDANYFSKKIEETGINKESVDQLKELLKLVEMLHSNNGVK